MAPTPERLQSLIMWQFHVTEQNHVSRYGMYNGEYYKQFLVDGKPQPAAYPPRKIPLVLYTTAQKRGTLLPR